MQLPDSTDAKLPLIPPANSSVGAASDLDRRRLRKFTISTGVLLLAFSFFIYQWIRLALKDDLYSHTILIPFICCYLAWQEKQKLRDFRPALGLSLFFAVLGAGLMASFWLLLSPAAAPSTRIALSMCALILLFWSLCAAFLGKATIKTLAFPLGFIIAMVPFPALFESACEAFLQHRSADAAYWLIKLSGTPVFREDTLLKLPGISLEVAPQCSGIRSTVVLFLTSLIAGHLFLKGFVNRTILAAAVIALGILRNGFRILTLAWLCVHVDPKIIESPLHHSGGPLFFALSLIPLFFLLYYLRRKEHRARKGS